MVLKKTDRLRLVLFLAVIPALLFAEGIFIKKSPLMIQEEKALQKAASALSPCIKIKTGIHWFSFPTDQWTKMALGSTFCAAAIDALGRICREKGETPPITNFRCEFAKQGRQLRLQGSTMIFEVDFSTLGNYDFVYQSLTE